MEILINFKLYNSSSSVGCRFWSCVLETPKELSESDLDDLNRNPTNKAKLVSMPNLSITAAYSIYTTETLSKIFDANKNPPRPKFFVPCSNSPYKNRSANITSYYADEKCFQLEFLKCVSSDNSVCSPIEYISIQKETVSAIKKIIGFDLLQCSSIPGCLSIYEKLPLFDDNDYNFNAKKGSRYITIKPPLDIPDVFSGEYTATVEALDRGKILYRRIVSFDSIHKFVFPDTNELEDFYEIRISICGKKGDEFIPLYEVHHTMIKSWSINGMVSGDRSRLLVNRYKGKELDKITQTDSFMSDSTGSNKIDWSDKDYNYNLETKGYPAEYLTSKFFDKTPAGREEFLAWTRKLFQNVKSVMVIDPYFDLNGFRDFLSCVNMPFDLTVLTTDPAKQSRSESDKNYSDENIKELTNEIFSAFPNAKIYFDGEDSFHDRYFVLDEKRYFSMSNSWNGSVNNFSMFVQELNLECSLKVQESFERIQNNSDLQEKKQEPLDTSDTEKKQDEIKKYEALVDSSWDAIQNLADATCSDFESLTSNYNLDSFYEFLHTVSKCNYYGMYKREDDGQPYTDDVVIELCSKAIKNICDDYKNFCIGTSSFFTVDSLIKKAVKNLLVNQKETFIKTKELISGKPLSYYDTIDKILKRVSQVEFIGNPTYKYDMDYCLYSILKCCFFVAPSIVIKELQEQEKEICKIVIEIKPATENTPAKTETKEYYVSEIILAAMLSQFYELVDVDDIDATCNLILRTESSYCRLCYATSFIDYSLGSDFIKIKEPFERLQLSKEELAAVLGELYSYKNSSRAKNNRDAVLKKKLLSEIFDYAISKLKPTAQTGDNLSDDELKPMLRFLFTAFIFKNTNLNVDEIFEKLSVYGNNSAKDIFSKLLLIHALEKVPDKQLYNFVLKNSEISHEMQSWFFAMQKELPGFTDDSPDFKRNPSIVDVSGFINNIPSFGSILSCYYFLDNNNDLKKNPQSRENADVLKNILFKIKLHLNLLFETSEYIESIDFDYYVLLIILYSLVDLKDTINNNENGVSENQRNAINDRINKELENIEWYLPFVINALSDDYYGLVYELLDAYLSFKSEAERKVLFDSINDSKLKIFIGSKIDDFLFTNERYNELITDVIHSIEFDSFEKTKTIIYLLNVFDSLVLCTSDTYKTDAAEILDVIESMLSTLNNQKINEFTRYGKAFFDNRTFENLNGFKNVQEKLYCPLSLRKKLDTPIQQGIEE